VNNPASTLLSRKFSIPTMSASGYQSSPARLLGKAVLTGTDIAHFVDSGAERGGACSDEGEPDLGQPAIFKDAGSDVTLPSPLPVLFQEPLDLASSTPIQSLESLPPYCSLPSSLFSRLHAIIGTRDDPPRPRSSRSASSGSSHRASHRRSHGDCHFQKPASEPFSLWMVLVCRSLSS
jgi:hypothetical protein